jgi:hypothetical protein
MPWPQTVDYNSAIQNPPACFADAELARGQPADGMMPGIPLSYAGNFATVYKMVDPTGTAWAVKCFTRKVENLQQRYKEISEHLNRRKRRFVVDFQYLAEGIRVAGTWYPVVKMQWVEGFTLNEFLRDRAGNTALLEQLCQLWLRLGNDMREDRMAHGDLQHGNVMLVPGSSATSMLLRLVDYDGMWVPALADLPPGEVGHANYQHPQRLSEGGYNDQIDRFAHLAIYTALRCLMVGGRALWAEHDNEENLLFREADFKLPGNSKLFPKLLALPDAATATLAGHLLLASQGPLEQVPLVNDLLAGEDVVPLSADQLRRVRALVPPPVAVAATPGPPKSRPPAIPDVHLTPPPPAANAPRSPVAVPDSSVGASDMPTAEQRPLMTTTVIDAMPGEELPILDALPAEPTKSDVVCAGNLRYRVVPLPDKDRPGSATGQPGSRPLKSGEKSIPPLPPPPPVPGAKAAKAWKMSPPPEWLLSLGLSENSLAARLWPVTLALLVTMACTPLLLLGAWLMGVFEHRIGPPPPVQTRPRLAEVAALDLGAGHDLEFVVPIERQSTKEPLTVRMDGLPGGVSYEPGNLPPGEGPTTVRMRLKAVPEAAAFTGDVIIGLYQDKNQLDEQKVSLTLTAFLWPELDAIGPISVEVGKSRLLQVRVKANGNTDPWKLDIRDLPMGVKFHPPTTPPTAGMVATVIEANASAPERDGVIIEVVLLAGGVVADRRPVPLSVERRHEDVKIDLVLPQQAIVLAVGGKTTFSVGVRRNGYKGPLRLEVEDLPAGVTAAGPITVPAGAVTAQVELRAEAEIAFGLELKSFRLVARLDDKLVGSHDMGTFRLVRSAVAGKPPGQDVPKPRMPAAQEVTFRSADGVQLHGTFYPSFNGVKGPCVLMVGEPKAGMSRKETSWVRLAGVLQKQGCAVFTFDFRGFGENRDSKDINPVLFWKHPENKSFPGFKKNIANAQAPTLDGAKFRDSYRPWLVQDIVAARFFLDAQHDASVVNTQNLIVVGAGEGATLASFWLAAEMRRHKAIRGLRTDNTFEGRDIIAAAWLDPSPSPPWTGISTAMKNLQRQLKSEKALPPMQFLYDRKAIRAEARTRDMMKWLLQKASAEKAIHTDTAGLTGQALLADPAAEKAVLEFIAVTLKKHELRPHTPRLLRLNDWYWSFANRPVLASGFVADVPGAFPVDVFGFKVR